MINFTKYKVINILNYLIFVFNKKYDKNRRN